MAVNVNDSILESKIKIDLNIKERLLNALKAIKDGFSSIINLKANADFNDSANLLKSQMIDFAVLLEQLELFRNEFDDFLEIEKMLRYTLNNANSIDLNQQTIIFESIYRFFDLIRYKIDSIENASLENDYLKRYDEFSLYLKKLKRHFYVNVCEYDDRFDDTMIKVSKILLS